MMLKLKNTKYIYIILKNLYFKAMLNSNDLYLKSVNASSKLVSSLTQTHLFEISKYIKSHKTVRKVIEYFS